MTVLVVQCCYSDQKPYNVMSVQGEEVRVTSAAVHTVDGERELFY